MIEVLEGVFYDPAKPWYEQDSRLIELGQEVVLTQPIGSEKETHEQNERVLWAEWEHTTTMGMFNMRIDYHWLYSIESRAFLSKVKQDSIQLTKI